MSTNKLDKRAILEIANGLAGGETVNVNHEDCPAGQDTKRRLYVSVPIIEPNMVLGYCHHCQGSVGVRRDKGFREEAKCRNVKGSFFKSPVIFSDEGIKFTGTTSEPCAFPDKALSILHKAGIKDPDFIKSIGITYSAGHNRLIYPYYNRQGEVYKAQARAIDPAVKPKYLTSEDTRRSQAPAPLGKAMPVVVLTEDLLSAARVARSGADVQALPLCGVTCSSKTLTWLARTYEQVVIWLDNDNETVIAAAHNLKDELTMRNACVKMVGKAEDAKHYSDGQIMFYLETAD